MSRDDSVGKRPHRGVGRTRVAQGDPSPQSHVSVINQLVSSGIVHPPSPRSLPFLYNRIGDDEEDVDRGMQERMLEFSGTGERFLWARSWLSLSSDEKDRIWAKWHVKGEARPYAKVIHPVGV